MQNGNLPTLTHMSLDTPTTIDTSGITTTIVDDGMTTGVALSTKPTPDPLSSTSESIRDFLAKPYMIFQGGWAETDLAGAFLFGGLGLKTDSWLEAIAPWYDKIKGFSMIRSTMVLRLQINATPFHQGKLLLHFLPAVGMHQKLVTTEDNYAEMHNWSLTTRTQQPSVELDCRETAVEMRVPYIVPTDYYLLGTEPAGMFKVERGSFYLSVLARLKAGTSTPNIDYTLWVSFEDVELVAPLVPQSGKGGKRKGLASQKEATAMANTPVANALSVAGKVASTLGSIPVLASIATPASWVLNAAAGLASAFGWSKPTNGNVAGPVSRQYNRYAATCDGSESSYPLGLSSTNHITTTTAKTITDDDEMSFSFLKSIPAYIDTVNWQFDAAQGASLYSKSIGPREIYSRASLTRNTTTVYLDSMPPFAYLSSVFLQYRGSIKVKIRIAKTDFHSGRLQVTFTPRTQVTTTPSVTSAFYSLREVIDIRSGNEMEFTLPYMMTTPYLSVEEDIGQLDVVVLNKLRAPSTVTQNIDLLFYYSAGEDFELAVPGYSENTVNWPPFSPESFGRDVANDETLVAEGIGGTPVVRADLSAAEHCVGEYFASVRQLLARFNQMWTATALPTGTQMAIWPFYASCVTLNSDGSTRSPAFGGDMFSFIAPMYAYYRGGMRVQVDLAAATGAISATLTPSQLKAGTAPVKTSTSLNGTGGTIGWVGSAVTSPVGTVVTDAGVGVAAFEVPYYSKTPISNVILTSYNTVPTLTGGKLEPTVPQSVISVENQSIAVLYRSIAEDFQLTYFVGCPPLRRSTTAFTATPLPLLREPRDMPLADDGRFDEVTFFATS